MSKSKPSKAAQSQTRIQVFCSKETYSAIERLAKAQGRSMSGVCAEFMDQLVPQMTMLSEAFELSRNDPELAVRLLTEKIKNASGEVASEVSALGQEVNAALGGSESEPKRGREE